MLAGAECRRKVKYRGKILDIRNRLPIRTIADHNEAARRDLSDQIGYIPSVAFSEFCGGPDGDQGRVSGAAASRRSLSRVPMNPLPPTIRIS